jgi:uncharacterized membrane protein
MIELNEKDVKAVARYRFWSKYQWRAAGGLVFVLVTVFVTGFLTNFDWLPGIVAFVLFIAGFIWIYLKQGKWERKFVEEWKSQKLG